MAIRSIKLQILIWKECKILLNIRIRWCIGNIRMGHLLCRMKKRCLYWGMILKDICLIKSISGHLNSSVLLKIMMSRSKTHFSGLDWCLHYIQKENHLLKQVGNRICLTGFMVLGMPNAKWLAYISATMMEQMKAILIILK